MSNQKTTRGVPAEWGLLYTSEARTQSGVPVRLSIYNTMPNALGSGFSQGKEVYMIADSLTLTTVKNGNSITHGTHATQLKVSLYSATDREFEAIASSDDRVISGRLTVGDTLLWQGFLDGEQWHEPYSFRDGYATELTFSDLGVLGRTRLSSVCGERKLYTIKGFFEACIDYVSFFGTKLKIKAKTTAYNALADLNTSLEVDRDLLKRIIAEGVLASASREIVSKTPVSIPMESSHPITQSIVDLTHWQEDKNKPEDEPDVLSVMESILKALNLHLWQSPSGDYILIDHEMLTTTQEHGELLARGADATIETTETYNRLTVTVDTDTDGKLAPPNWSSINGNEVQLVDLNDPITDVTACTITHFAELNQPLMLPDGTRRSNRAYRVSAGSVGSDEKGVAFECTPFTLFHNVPGTKSTEFKFLEGCLSRGMFGKEAVDKGLANIFSPWGEVADYCYRDTYTPLLTEEFRLPQVDLTTASEYYLAFSLDLFLDNGYNPYQRDPELKSARAKRLSKEARKNLEKRKAYLEGVKGLFLEAEITCGDYKLMNCTRLDRLRYRFISPTGDETLLFQTRWVHKGDTSARLLVPYADIKRGVWSKPTRNVAGIFDLGRGLAYMPTFQRAANNDKLTLPLPPNTNAPIRISTSGRFAPVSSITVNRDGVVKMSEQGLPHYVPSIMSSGYALDKAINYLNNLVSFYLARNMRLELVRRDEKQETSEEIVLASTLNAHAFETRKETLDLSTDPALPSISKTLLRTLKDPIVEDGPTPRMGPALIVTLPPIRGKLSCGKFQGTLEELYIAEQYTHYAQRRNRISGTYAPLRTLTVRHEGKQFLATEVEEDVLAERASLTVEEIKSIDYDAKYIERS